MSLPGVVVPPPVSMLRTENRGSLLIAGVTKVAGVNAPCRVSLHVVKSGLCVGFRRSGDDGAYSFPDLSADDYYLVIEDDRQNVKRSKVEHVTLT